MAEHPAVNRRVVSSSLTCGAIPINELGRFWTAPFSFVPALIPAFEKLEELALSVAQHHLKTIELFGAIIGFFIGVGQAIYFWFTYHPR